MPKIEVTCPSCKAILKVPEEYLGKKGRCRACKAVFPIAALLAQPAEAAGVNEDSIADWLSEDPAGHRRAAAPEAAEAEKTAEALLKPASAETPPQAAPPERLTVRLGHVDDMGAFFLFPPELLYDENFRAGLPQCCMICGGKSHLTVHLVIWSTKLPERGHFGAHTSYSKSVFDLDELGGVQGRDLLAMLDPIENLPEPYSLPMPYYVCRTCSAVGAVVPDVRFAADGTRQECELGISSLRRALEFAAAVCEPDSPAHEQIREAIRGNKDDAWKALPLAVRSRIKHWYQAADGEHFVAYIADGDFAKTEAGMAGIVLTDRRLIYHKFAAMVEIPLTEPITIVAKTNDGHPQLEISSPGSKPILLAADEAATEQLRRHLQSQGAKAEWPAA